MRSYDDRRARARDGGLRDENPHLVYAYHRPGIELRHALSESWRLYLSYDLLVRDDRHVGYNDYTRHRGGARAKYGDRRERTLELGFRYWTRDYPRGFAFDDPAFSRKQYRTWEVAAKGELPLAERWALWAEQEYEAQDSADPRYDYARSQLLAGLRFEL